MDNYARRDIMSEKQFVKERPAQQCAGLSFTEKGIVHKILLFSLYRKAYNIIKS